MTNYQEGAEAERSSVGIQKVQVVNRNGGGVFRSSMVIEGFQVRALLSVKFTYIVKT